jgi:cytochrome b561
MRSRVGAAAPAAAVGQRQPAAATRYTRTAIVLHWLVAALVVAQVGWGWAMLAIAQVTQGPRADAFNFHKSVGLVILALMLVRLAWRLAHPAPPLDGLPAWQQRAARATHAVLYAALLIMPIAGYLGSAWSGYPVRWFGMTLPAWASAQPALKTLMSQVHLATSFVLLGAVLLHVAAGVRHALRRDDYFMRMWRSRRTGRRPRGAEEPRRG